VGDSEETVTGKKTTYGPHLRLVVMEVWGGRKLEMQLYQRYRVTTVSTEVQPDSHETATKHHPAEPHRLPAHLYLADLPCYSTTGAIETSTIRR